MPNDIRMTLHLNVKRTLHTVDDYPRGYNFESVSLKDLPFSRYKVVEIRNAPNDLRIILNT